MDKALRASDGLEKALQKRIEQVYGDALKQARRAHIAEGAACAADGGVQRGMVGGARRH